MAQNATKLLQGKPTIAVLGSHSALEVCLGAKKQGFKTLVVAQKGRDKTYADYFKSHNGMGCVDQVLYVKQFKDILKEDVQKTLLKKNAIFVPHRSFEVYINDYDAIEKKFMVPMFGNRFLLRAEERSEHQNQYDILKKATISFPKIFKSPKEIDRLVIVKVLQQKISFERGFFLVSSPQEFEKEAIKRIKQQIISRDTLQKAVIEEFIIGAPINFNFFYSPLRNKLELVGTDMRRQTNLEGFLRLPSPQQQQALKYLEVSFKEIGHVAVTILESLIEEVMETGERFVRAAKEMYPHGVIGPFGLQALVRPMFPKHEIVVYDVAPRMPGSPGIAATPYSTYLYGRSVSMGERVAMEIKEAIRKKQLQKILT